MRSPGSGSAQGSEVTEGSGSEEAVSLEIHRRTVLVGLHLAYEVGVWHVGVAS